MPGVVGPPGAGLEATVSVEVLGLLLPRFNISAVAVGV